MLEKITAVGVASSERRRCTELNKMVSRGLGITEMTMEQRPEAAKGVAVGIPWGSTAGPGISECKSLRPGASVELQGGVRLRTDV